eukprot:GHRR01007187.1.p1 GENE.GHRR01007187.1~~GHRR01007187.1.p1  ORF type:complete len:183 (+),score=27.78 GHRR01007187.1:727-1275(+)
MGAVPGKHILTIENDLLKTGVDPKRGGGICWLSKKSGENVLNEYDCGRFIQQSYYGKEDDSLWNGKPWRWNPVQCGSWQNQPACVRCCHIEKPGYIVTKVHPRNWAGQQLLEDVHMRSDISLAEDHVHIKFTMSYNGPDAHPVRIQELPAVFISRRLSQLVFYSGRDPWKVCMSCYTSMQLG